MILLLLLLRLIRKRIASTSPPSLRTVHPELSSPLIKSDATNSTLKDAFEHENKINRMHGMGKHLPSSD